MAVKVSSYTNQKENNRVEIVGLTAEEKDRLLGVVDGMWWLRCVEGVPVFTPAYEKIPDPVEDPRLSEFWPRKEKNPPRYSQIQLRDPEEYKTSSPSITIGSLCGYYYTPEKYAKEAERLTSYGFCCLRSQRGQEGRFWEHWYLPGLWAARGDLEWKILCLKRENERKTKEDEEKLKREKGKYYENPDARLIHEVIRYLCQHVSFGTLDASVQRAAMAMDD